MELIVDTSALLAVILDEPERASIIEATEGATLMAPGALSFEIGNALTAMVKRGRLERDAVLPAWNATQRIPVQIVSVEIDAALHLALTQGIYAYDAYYLQCSLSPRRPLLTLDRRMRQVAEALGIQLVV